MKKLIPFFILIVLSIFWIWIGVKSTPEFLNIITYPKNYNLVTANDDKDLKVELFLSNVDNYYTNIDNMTNEKLESSEGVIELVIKEIVVLDTIKIKGEDYHRCYFIFKVNAQSNEVVQYDDVILIINYDMIESVNILIGSVTLGNIPYSHDESGIMNLISMEGIVSKVDGVKSLVAIVLTINANEQLNIRKMQLYDDSAFISGEEARLIEDDYENKTIDELLGYKYNEKEYLGENMNLIVTGKNTILFPVKNAKSLNETGFKLIYTINDVEYNFYYENFLFFNDLEKENMEFKKYTYAYR